MLILSIFLHGMEDPQHLPPLDVRRRYYLRASQFGVQMKFKLLRTGDMPEKSILQFLGLYP